ncbi:MAG: type II toxin-antitoxin system RelE/ParE family toxin [Burkholderiales bacterium]|nr:MAG: type II toxin-antitoxin system RelE/ParE family toxin [Burkholderiales bacterium]
MAAKAAPGGGASYELAIHDDALAEWRKLDESIKQRFKKKLAKERLLQPRVSKDILHGLPDCYKIKITTPQFRLAYHVNDAEKLLTIIAVSSRDDVYALLENRHPSLG